MGPGLGGGRERRVIPFLFNTNNHLQPILEFFIHYVGSAEEAAPYLKPFQDLSPLYPNGQYYAYPDIYDYFRNVTTSQLLHNQSIVVFEACSLEGVKAVDPASTAFPHREENILCDVLVTYDPDSSLDAEAVAIGKKITQFWADGQPYRQKHIYVNCAFGDERLDGYQCSQVAR
ncbi:hypothetical protein MAP00_007965 [Monascus purpureus]|nr:hypothetical protein MAP00_007965 [Monascus purpureus]